MTNLKNGKIRLMIGKKCAKTVYVFFIFLSFLRKLNLNFLSIYGKIFLKSYNSLSGQVSDEFELSSFELSAIFNEQNRDFLDVTNPNGSVSNFSLCFKFRLLVNLPALCLLIGGFGGPVL